MHVFLATITIVALLWGMRNQILILEYRRRMNGVYDTIQAYRRNDGKISPLAAMKAIEQQCETS